MDESMSLQSSLEQSNNVIAFPSSAIRKVRVTTEETREAVQRSYVDEVTESYATYLTNKFAQQGFNVFDPEFDRHFGFAMEALRSTLLKTMSLSHPFQQIVEATIMRLDDETPVL